MTFKEWKDLPNWFKYTIYSIEGIILLGTVVYLLRDNL